LLELIETRGSLNKAAEELEMSYRNAWGYLQELERAAGFKLIERAPGRGPRSGMRLTARGKGFLDRYRKFRTAVEGTVDRQFTKAFARAPRSRRSISA